MLLDVFKFCLLIPGGNPKVEPFDIAFILWSNGGVLGKVTLDDCVSDGGVGGGLGLGGGRLGLGGGGLGLGGGGGLFGGLGKLIFVSIPKILSTKLLVVSFTKLFILFVLLEIAAWKSGLRWIIIFPFMFVKDSVIGTTGTSFTSSLFVSEKSSESSDSKLPP